MSGMATHRPLLRVSTIPCNRSATCGPLARSESAPTKLITPSALRMVPWRCGHTAASHNLAPEPARKEAH